METKDIEGKEDIKEMVNSFYAKVQKDPLIGPIFNEVIGERWDQHLHKMHGFWNTILFNVQEYSGSPFPPHAKLPIEKIHFERWLELFNKNMDNLFEGKKAEEGKWRAKKMAEMFNFKIDYLKNEKS
jgi:hemoglobin